MGTKRQNLENAGSCWSKAEDDEPVFVLRAHDALAPGAVRVWALRAQNNGVRREKVEAALQVAKDMERWQAANLEKLRR